MRFRTSIVAALLGALVAAVVGYWPQGPMWRSGPKAGTLEHFSPDGRILITTERGHEKGVPIDPVLSRWDVETGELLSRAVMSCENPKSIRNVVPSADGSRALVGEGTHEPDLGGGHLMTGRWYLHDGLTGRRLAGPLAGIARADRGAFSLDGRWFVALRGDPDIVDLKLLTGAAVGSAENGEVVLSEGHLISPDGGTVVVGSTGGKDTLTKVGNWRSVRILELPSGRELRCVDLPAHDYLYFDLWDGQQLHALVNEDDEVTQTKARRRRVLHLWKEPVGDVLVHPVGDLPSNELERDFYRDGPDWVAYYGRPKQPASTGWAGWLQGVLERTRFARKPSGSVEMSIHIVDRHTGATRYRTPRPLNITILISPDGRRIACDADTDDERIEMWDAAPTPRWPMALGGGLVAAAGVVALRRWRDRMKRTRNAS